MIRQCNQQDFEKIHSIINEAASVYKGVIPEDRWKVPYMAKDDLKHEIDAGVVFWGFEEGGRLRGVMGIQHVQDVTLIRHAYVRPKKQRRGIGKKLLWELCKKSDRPILIGTWADATWAIRFYEKYGFKRVGEYDKNRLLEKYWSIPARQVAASVVLADRKWFDLAYRDLQNLVNTSP
jgi:N-acetylglutamate synthase-like GNAT family acetyltransferase